MVTVDQSKPKLILRNGELDVVDKYASINIIFGLIRSI